MVCLWVTESHTGGSNILCALVAPATPALQAKFIAHQHLLVKNPCGLWFPNQSKVQMALMRLPVIAFSSQLNGCNGMKSVECCSLSVGIGALDLEDAARRPVQRSQLLPSGIPK